MPAPHHPAPFSDPIMAKLRELVADWEGPILDPYAGIGRVHELGRDDTYGIEIEQEWADAHPSTWRGDSATLRVSLDVPEEMAFEGEGGLTSWLPRPHAIVTSPDYGNRMADQYLGTPSEQALRATTGEMPRRRGYAMSLGRRVSEGSASGLHFGRAYKDRHSQIFTAVTKVCLPDAKLALNVSDFFASKVAGAPPQRAHVVSFWVELVVSLGWVVERVIPVGTRRFRDGANSDLRVDAEQIVVATLKGAK